MSNTFTLIKKIFTFSNFINTYGLTVLNYRLDTSDRNITLKINDIEYSLDHKFFCDTIYVSYNSDIIGQIHVYGNTYKPGSFVAFTNSISYVIMPIPLFVATYYHNDPDLFCTKLKNLTEITDKNTFDTIMKTIYNNYLDREKIEILKTVTDVVYHQNVYKYLTSNEEEKKIFLQYIKENINANVHKDLSDANIDIILSSQASHTNKLYAIIGLLYNIDPSLTCHNLYFSTVIYIALNKIENHQKIILEDTEKNFLSLKLVENIFFKYSFENVFSYNSKILDMLTK